MIRKTIALLGTAMIALAVTPAAHATDDNLNGLTCGFVSTTDPNSQDPDAQTGEVDAHFSLHSTTGGLTDLTITCTIQINTGVYGAGGTPNGNTCFPPNPLVSNVIVCSVAAALNYTATVGDDVYLCTEVVWHSAKGGGTYQYDGDDVTAGNQCALATTIEA